LEALNVRVSEGGAQDNAATLVSENHPQPIKIKQSLLITLVLCSDPLQSFGPATEIEL